MTSYSRYFSEKEWFTTVEESTKAMDFDIQQMIISIIYSDELKIPKSVADAMSPTKAKKQKLAVFHPFY